MESRVLTYEATGSGPPIVLVPGALTGWLAWIPHAERLSATRRAIRVQPIHNELGSAGQPGDLSYTWETERESLRLTLDALGLETGDFAGWSGGGRALLEFTLQYPQRVRTLTLVEPAAYWVLEQLGERDEQVDRLNDFIRSIAGRDISDDELGTFLELAGFIQPGEDPRQHPQWERWVPHKQALSWQRSVDRSERSLDELGSISCPVLLVKGTVTADWLKRVVDVLAQRIPGATVVELEGNHASFIQSIDAFLEALETHLAGAPAEPRQAPK
jgi:pimeloyl-ACP methyl ester carboxylesterase